MDALLEVAKVFGLPFALLVAYFVVTSKKEAKRAAQDVEREKNTIAKINEVETYTRTKLESLVTDNTMAMTQVSETNISLGGKIDNQTNELRKRKCLVDSDL